MAQDLKNRCAVLESKEREKIGTELYDQLHGLNNEGVPAGLEKEIHMYPQGGNKQARLRDQFEQSPPFYLRENKGVFNRKTNETHYLSTMEQARSRFEAQLHKTQQDNQKNLDEYQQYMDETSKFNELKALKEAQNKLLVKSVLESQMEQERAKRERSKEDRRSNAGGEWTFGPKETNETLMYQKLKKKQDTA